MRLRRKLRLSILRRQNSPSVDEPAVRAPTDAVATEVASVDAAPTDSPGTDKTAVEAAPSVAEIVDAAPEGTQVVVMDATGQPLPLASEAAAAMLLTGDPMWCPDGKLPGDVGCTASHSGFNASGYDPATGNGLILA